MADDVASGSSRESSRLSINGEAARGILSEDILAARMDLRTASGIVLRLCAIEIAVLKDPKAWPR
jgi:hypothetical protein